MPNHVTNRLILTGDPKVIAHLKNSIKTKHEATPHTSFGGDLTYEKTDENGISYGWLNEKTKHFSTRVNGTLTTISTTGVPAGWKQHFEKAFTHYIDFEKIIPSPKFIFTGGLSSDDQNSNPNRNWLDFNNTFWGTKWNSYSTRLDKKGNIIFETAWSCPKPLLERLSWLFPEITMTVETLDEGGNFWGTITFLGGSIVRNDIKSYNGGVDSEYKRLCNAFRKR